MVTQRGPHPFQTTQGNRLSCRHQEGRRGSEEAVPGPSVFPSGEPGVSGDVWGSQEGCQGVIEVEHPGQSRSPVGDHTSPMLSRGPACHDGNPASGQLAAVGSGTSLG